MSAARVRGSRGQRGARDWDHSFAEPSCSISCSPCSASRGRPAQRSASFSLSDRGASDQLLIARREVAVRGRRSARPATRGAPRPRGSCGSGAVTGAGSARRAACGRRSQREPAAQDVDRRSGFSCPPMSSSDPHVGLLRALSDAGAGDAPRLRAQCRGPAEAEGEPGADDDRDRQQRGDAGDMPGSSGLDELESRHRAVAASTVRDPELERPPMARPAAWAALARQSLAPAEVIVVDNGSTDGSLEYLRGRASGGGAPGARPQHRLRARGQPRPRAARRTSSSRWSTPTSSSRPTGWPGWRARSMR